MDLMASYLMLKAGTFFLSTNSTIFVSLLNPNVPLIGVAVFLSAPVRCRYSASSNLLTLPAGSCPEAKKEAARTTARNLQSIFMNYLLKYAGGIIPEERAAARRLLAGSLALPPEPSRRHFSFPRLRSFTFSRCTALLLICGYQRPV